MFALFSTSFIIDHVAMSDMSNVADVAVTTRLASTLGSSLGDRCQVYLSCKLNLNKNNKNNIPK